MFEPSDKVFDPTPIKLPYALHNWREANKVKIPTKHALIYGGFLLANGKKDIVFEAKFDRIAVDVLDEEARLITEVDGERQREQSLDDGRRDYFVLLNTNVGIQRITNQQIADFIPKSEQMRYSLLAVEKYKKQLEHWKENRIPDYYQKYKNKNENMPSVFAEEIIQSYEEIDWLN